MILSSEQHKKLLQRVDRHRRFYARSEPGDLLVMVRKDQRYASLESFLCKQFYNNDPEVVLEKDLIKPMIVAYLDQMRILYPKLYEWDDDMIPTGIVYWGIGGIVASQTGLNPLHQENTSWLEPNLSWDTIDTLSFDEGNRWVQFALNVNKALWELWDEDFFILPFLHRSPLDSANGIRGTELFIEMYTQAERVKSLIDWCADWSIAMEQYLGQHDGRRTGWGCGVWDAWIPEGAVFVNGDPVGLISREMMPEFEQPFTAKLFTQTGGGFFHNHTVGLYQVDQVSETEGLLIQAFVDDPNQLSMVDALLGEDDALRKKIVESSLRKPIQANVTSSKLDAVLEVVSQGRFSLWVNCEEQDSPAELIDKVRRVSNLR